MAYRDVILADNPVRYWRLGESSGTAAVDETAGQNLTYVDSPTLGQTGLLDGDADTCVLFNGTSQYARAIEVTTYVAGAAWSYEIWGKTSTSDPDRVLFSEGSSVSNTPFICFQTVSDTGLRLRIFYRNDASTSLLITDTAGVCNDGARHYWAMTCSSGGTISLYRDGQFVDSGARPSGAITTDQIGIATLARTGFDQFWPGHADEGAIYNYELTSTQIAAHYDAGLGIGGGPTHPYVSVTVS